MTEPAEEPGGPSEPLVNLVIVCTGSVNAAVLPAAVAGLRLRAPGVRQQLVVTRSATRFVSPDALSVITGRPALLDVWPETFTSAPHVELVEWADAFLVYPATAHYFARLAHGLADTPSLLALAGTTAPIAIAPAMPEGVWQNPITQRNAEVLAELGNVTVVPPVPGRSWGTGRDTGWLPPALPAVLGPLLARLAEQGRTRSGQAGPAS